MKPQILIQSVDSNLYTYTHDGKIGDRLTREEMLAEVAAILFDAPTGPRYLQAPESVRRFREQHQTDDPGCPSPLFRGPEHDLWCVVRDGPAKPFSFTTWHPDRESADREAERLARNVGETFYVLRVVGKCKGVKPSVEWIKPDGEMPF